MKGQTQIRHCSIGFQFWPFIVSEAWVKMHNTRYSEKSTQSDRRKEGRDCLPKADNNISERNWSLQGAEHTAGCF